MIVNNSNLTTKEQLSRIMATYKLKPACVASIIGKSISVVNGWRSRPLCKPHFVDLYTLETISKKE